MSKGSRKTLKTLFAKLTFEFMIGAYGKDVQNKLRNTNWKYVKPVIWNLI